MAPRQPRSRLKYHLFSVNPGDFFLPLDFFKKVPLLKESKKETGKKFKFSKKTWNWGKKTYRRYVFDPKSSSGDLFFACFENWLGGLFIVGIFLFISFLFLRYEQIGAKMKLVSLAAYWANLSFNIIWIY